MLHLTMLRSFARGFNDQVNCLKAKWYKLDKSYHGHFFTISDKQKLKNEASDEFLGEAKTVLGEYL